METIDTEICSEPGISDKRGRRVLGKAAWLKLLAEYDQCGLTQRAFCQRQGINYSTFVAWLGRRKRMPGQVRRESQADKSKLAFREFALPAAQERSTTGSVAPMLEVVLPDGIVLRGSQPDALALLVRSLQR